jgi:hypothetical protein
VQAQDAFALISLVYIVVMVAAIGMAFYIGYLAIRALRKYLRS